MWGPLGGALFILFWLFHEISARRRLGLAPTSWKELLRLGQKKYTSNKKVTAAIFSVTTLWIFAFWESILRAVLGRENSALFFLAGLCVAGFSLYFRKKSFQNSMERGRLTRGDAVLAVLAWTLLMGSAFSLLLAPWVAWRMSFLPRRFQRAF